MQLSDPGRHITSLCEEDAVNPCTRVGIDVTWVCNWTCGHCFYRRKRDEHQSCETLMGPAKEKILQAKRAGLDHVVMVGYGEPSLARTTPEILDFAHELGMATSMITNAAGSLSCYKRFFGQGLDHLHISSHGLNGTLDKIAGVDGAFAKQAEVKEWLASEGLPFRTNATIQQLNYRELPDLAEYEISKGVFHFVMLGFLPHYEWKDHLTEVAVHPAELRPYIEEAADRLIESDTYFTIRYHPLCHLSPKYWPYVVNTRYVFFDPWEWNYELQIRDVDALWDASKRMGDSVACVRPCRHCAAYRHCGGWNGVYAEGFAGAGLEAIEGPPMIYQAEWDRDGGLHDLNPANGLTGTIR